LKNAIIDEFDYSCVPIPQQYSHFKIPDKFEIPSITNSPLVCVANWQHHFCVIHDSYGFGKYIVICGEPSDENHHGIMMIDTQTQNFQKNITTGSLVCGSLKEK